LARPGAKRKPLLGGGTPKNAATKTPHAYVDLHANSGGDVIDKLTPPKIGGKVKTGPYMTGFVCIPDPQNIGNLTDGIILESPILHAPGINGFQGKGFQLTIQSPTLGANNNGTQRFKTKSRVFDKWYFQTWFPTNTESPFGISGLVVDSAFLSRTFIRFYLNGTPVTGYLPLMSGVDKTRNDTTPTVDAAHVTRFQSSQSGGYASTFRVTADEIEVGFWECSGNSGSSTFFIAGVAATLPMDFDFHISGGNP
jgi:hypothetical protein